MVEQNGNLPVIIGDGAAQPDHRLGIPYKMTTQRLNKYIKHIQAGIGRSKAAQMVGVDRSTMGRHISASPDFANRVTDAEMYANDHMVEAHFASGIAGNVTAQINWLKHRLPDDWADKPKEWKPPGSSPDNPVYIAPGQIDWDHVPIELAERFLALNAELKAAQPQSGGLVVEAEFREVNEDGKD